MGPSHNRSLGRTATWLLVFSSLGATAALAQEASPPSDEAAASSPDPDSVPLPPPDEKDVYNQFAKEVLKSERAGNADAVHPLAAKYPNDDVIVCQAGCAPGGEIVYKERKKPRVAETAEMVPTSSRPSANSNTLSCVAGCYTTPKAYKSVEKRNDLIAPAPAPQASAAPKPAATAAADAASPSSWATEVVRTDDEAAPSAAKPAVVAVAEVPPAAPVAPKVETKIAAVPAPAPAAAAVPADGDKPSAATAAVPAATPERPAAPVQPQIVAKAEPVASEQQQKDAAAAPISVASNDAEMNSAIAKARAGLEKFWTAMKAPGPGETGFSLKVAITENGETEHFWVSKIERDGDVIRGIINNKPSLVTSIRAGQPYEFKADRISDWLYMRNGKMVGNETMRPLLARMPAKQAEAYRALLETP